MKRVLVIHTDGGSRGNPGAAAVGVTAGINGQAPIYELAAPIGVATNNQAEYQAIIRSLSWWLSLQNKPEIDKIIWKLDSKLVVEQLNHRWKIKEAHLRPLAEKAWHQLKQLSIPFQIVHVPREENARADMLLNQALDAI